LGAGRDSVGVLSGVARAGVSSAAGRAGRWRRASGPLLFQAAAY